MRIAHFSDPHLLDLTGARVRDFLNKRWLGGVNLLANRARRHRVEVFEAMVEELNRGGVDHVLCTGDVTNVSMDCEFRYARAHFDRFTLGPEGVTVIPGNHDVYVAEGLDFFHEYFDAYTVPDDDWRWPGGSRWPVVRVRGDVAIIGVSSSIETPWFQAWGQVGDAQLARLRDILCDDRMATLFRLVAIHHPPAGRRAQRRVRGLRDHQRFARVIEECGAELVLHGHEHLDMREALPGPGDAVPVHGIQSSTYDGSSDRTQARYRVYEIERTVGHSRPRVTAEELRVWRAAESAFADDPGLGQAVAAAT